jgi:ribonuclease P protein component
MVKRAGRRLRTEHLEVRALDSLLSHARVAVVVGKHGHTIIERNRLRRRLRELTRVGLIPVAGGRDIVIRTFSTAYGATFDQLKGEIESLSTRLSTSTPSSTPS